MMIENADYFVRLIKMPPHTDGMVSPNGDGTFNMYLSKDKFRPEIIDDYIHEYEHIDNDDFSNGKPIGEIERERR